MTRSRHPDTHLGYNEILGVTVPSTRAPKEDERRGRNLVLSCLGLLTEKRRDTGICSTNRKDTEVKEKTLYSYYLTWTSIPTTLRTDSTCSLRPFSEPRTLRGSYTSHNDGKEGT